MKGVSWIVAVDFPASEIIIVSNPLIAFAGVFRFIYKWKSKFRLETVELIMRNAEQEARLAIWRHLETFVCDNLFDDYTSILSTSVSHNGENWHKWKAVNR